MLINTRRDLEALRGSPDYGAALLLILGATKTWINVAPVDEPPQWVEQTASETLQRLDLTEQELVAELNALGIVPVASPPPAVESPSKSDLIARAADKRWRIETGGCRWGDYVVATDRDSQSKLVAEFVAVQSGLRADPSPWKFADGSFAVLSNADVVAVIMAARTHIAECFAVEKAVVGAIDSGAVTTFRQIEDADWPQIV